LVIGGASKAALDGDPPLLSAIREAQPTEIR